MSSQRTFNPISRMLTNSLPLQKNTRNYSSMLQELDVASQA